MLFGWFGLSENIFSKKIWTFSKNLDEINNHEFKITSQNNEDGIIEYIFKKIPNSKVFVEIGLSYYEFNSLNLIKNNWSGLLVEQNFNECLVLRKLLNFYYPKLKVEIINKSINKENVNSVIVDNLKAKYIDFFSIDISNVYFMNLPIPVVFDSSGLENQ